MKRRNFILLLGGGGSAALSTGTGAFSSMEAERGVEVNVVDDSEAFVGYHTPEQNDGTVKNGDRITLVEIRNRFSEGTSISLVSAQIERGSKFLVSSSYEVERRIEDTDPPEYEPVDHAEVVESPTEPDASTVPTDGFEPGLYERITAKVTGVEPNEPVEIAVTVSVRGVAGSGVGAQLFGDTRAFHLTGADDPWNINTPVVDFKGNSGNAKLKGVDPDFEIPTRVWYRDGSGTLGSKTPNLPNGQIRNMLFTGGNRKDKRIVAVSLTGINRTYIREDDNLNPGDAECYDGVPEAESEFDTETLSVCD